MKTEQYTLTSARAAFEVIAKTAPDAPTPRIGFSHNLRLFPNRAGRTFITAASSSVIYGSFAIKCSLQCVLSSLLGGPSENRARNSKDPGSSSFPVM